MNSVGSQNPHPQQK
ncbi:hypothetical protein G210_0091 [Candida maltosa Xu316]|uniref:Uncharacterized protein n=1 Tax=Candida maltosa (strain Xu316) TaxID=1245528 RepID=M3HP07_CANMX|nr:hypothetical protein G210_0091 [Candida maltosa Xu316]